MIKLFILVYHKNALKISSAFFRTDQNTHKWDKTRMLTSSVAKIDLQPIRGRLSRDTSLLLKVVKNIEVTDKPLIEIFRLIRIMDLPDEMERECGVRGDVDSTKSERGVESEISAEKFFVGTSDHSEEPMSEDEKKSENQSLAKDSDLGDGGQTENTDPIRETDPMDVSLSDQTPQSDTSTTLKPLSILEKIQIAKFMQDNPNLPNSLVAQNFQTKFEKEVTEAEVLQISNSGMISLVV